MIFWHLRVAVFRQMLQLKFMKEKQTPDLLTLSTTFFNVWVLCNWSSKTEMRRFGVVGIRGVNMILIIYEVIRRNTRQRCPFCLVVGCSWGVFSLILVSDWLQPKVTRMDHDMEYTLLWIIMKFWSNCCGNWFCAIYLGRELEVLSWSGPVAIAALSTQNPETFFQETSRKTRNQKSAD